MKKRIFLLAALAAGLVLCLAACGETNGAPVTVTLWHVYGGEVNSPMNALVDEFNRTVGQAQSAPACAVSPAPFAHCPDRSAPGDGPRTPAQAGAALPTLRSPTQAVPAAAGLPPGHPASDPDIKYRSPSGKADRGTGTPAALPCRHRQIWESR